jgi:hypothetical protein
VTEYDLIAENARLRAENSTLRGHIIAAAAVIDRLRMADGYPERIAAADEAGRWRGRVDAWISMMEEQK